MPRAETAWEETEEARWEKLQQDVAVAADDEAAVRILRAFVECGEQRLKTWTPDKDSELLTRHMRDALAQMSRVVMSSDQDAAFGQQHTEAGFAYSCEQEVCVFLLISDRRAVFPWC